ncbi:hypothetical protein NDU88_003891 [Pleurodeles waltl]|uniref:Uncharacterized protein n=1 Tax=Pleurodeles waltl TaxID=8319 RepID=A0AAV7W6A5_PLEWA|nr:hypothetical protein NDU88_003891 [Pleurodeles waltl]
MVCFFPAALTDRREAAAEKQLIQHASQNTLSTGSIRSRSEEKRSGLERAPQAFNLERWGAITDPKERQ